MAYTAGSVMNAAASLLNDTARTLYTYAVQLPYLRMAQKSLEKDFLLHSIPLQFEVSAVIPVLAGATTLTLPADFFLPIKLEERRTGSTSVRDFIEIKELSDEPSENQVETLSGWVFRENEIKFLGATQNRDVKLYYYRLIPTAVDENTSIIEDGASNVLAFKTAALISKYIGQNYDRALALISDGEDELDKLLSIYVKKGQFKPVRRRPYRARR